jgi:hypothetical protein
MTDKLIAIRDALERLHCYSVRQLENKCKYIAESVPKYTEAELVQLVYRKHDGFFALRPIERTIRALIEMGVVKIREE